MGSKSKSKKNGTDEFSPDSTSVSSKKSCIVCCAEPSDKIVRDANFGKVMQFYVEGLDIDVKPSEYSNFDLCGTCYEGMLEFYDTNDVLVLLETHLKDIRAGLVSNTLKGIRKLKNDGNPLHPIHFKVTQKWGDFIDAEKGKTVEVGSSVESTLEDIPTAPAGGSPGKSPSKKYGSGQSKSGNTASAEKEISNGKKSVDEVAAANTREQRAKRRK